MNLSIYTLAPHMNIDRAHTKLSHATKINIQKQGWQICNWRKYAI